MKNGIAMISKLSRPVNSFIDTDSIGTSLRMNRNVSTVRPSAIETGMPVSMKAISSTNIVIARTACDPRLTVMRQITGPVVMPCYLQEAEAHQPGTERDGRINGPHRRFEVVRLLAGAEHLADERAAKERDRRSERRAAHDCEQDHWLARMRRQQIDQDVDADMDAGAHAIGGAEFRHPDEHVDAEFLRPRQIACGKPGIDRSKYIWDDRYSARGCPFGEIDGKTSTVAMQDSNENQRCRRRDKAGDQPFFEVVQHAPKRASPGSHKIGREVPRSRPFFFFLI